MKVLALVPSKRGYSPGQRGSIELWERVLEPAGIHLCYAPFESDRLRQILYEPGRHLEKAEEMIRSYVDRLRLLRDLGDYDAVFVYREAALLGPAFLEKKIARKGKPIIYQLDDPLYVPYRSPANGYLSYLKFFGKVADICRLSTVVIVNSTHHRQFAEQYNKNIWQIPSIVDTKQYTFQPEVLKTKRVCIGWSGSPTTVGNIRLVADALRQLSRRGDHDVHLIGGDKFDLPGVKYTNQLWSAETEVADLRKMQIGMVPVPVNEWNKRKFFMKSAQYMALGIPPVATPIGSNPEVIEHGQTGFLADSTDEWVEYLGQLIGDHDLRLRMSHKAAQTAIERYSLEANTAKVIDAFRSAIINVGATRPAEAAVLAVE